MPTVDGRRLREVFRRARNLQRAEPGTDPASVCLSLIKGSGPAAIQDALASFDGDAFDYAVASIYTLLLSDERRRELGAYFTPPHLVGHLLDRLGDHGFDCVRHSVHDPAAGGAAFVVPLVRRAARELLAGGMPPDELLASLSSRLSGMELDHGLARVSNALVRRALQVEFAIEAGETFRLVQQGDSLNLQVRPAEVVLGNPPYAKIGAVRQREWAPRFPDILGGQLNLYAMFLRRSLDIVRPGGLLGFVVPTSFLHGPEFKTLRIALLRHADLLHLDLIEKRKGMFLDVTQDTCFVVLRRLLGQRTKAVPAFCATLKADGSCKAHGTFEPPGDGLPWKLPSSEPMPWGGHVLSDLGYRCTVGHLVVNRQQERLSDEPGNGRVPLVRAACVRADGAFDLLNAKRQYVTVPSTARYLVRDACVLIQRTANQQQARRINAAFVPQGAINEHGGLVGENHVLFMRAVGRPKVAPADLARLMNSSPVNERWGGMCGTVSLSAKLLADLDLPLPSLIQGLADLPPDMVDAAVAAAYARSAEKGIKGERRAAPAQPTVKALKQVRNRPGIARVISNPEQTAEQAGV